MRKKVPTASLFTFNGYIWRRFCVFQPLLTPNMPAELCNLLICTLYNFHPNDSLLGLASGGLWRPLEASQVPTASFLTFNGYILRHFCVFQPLLTRNVPSELCSLLICTLHNFHPCYCLLGLALWRPLEASDGPNG